MTPKAAKPAAWFSYRPPPITEDRTNVRQTYMVWLMPLELEIGRVECYYDSDVSEARKWRTLDHWHHDWRGGFTSREAACKDLLANSPRTVRLVQMMTQHRERKAVAAGTVPA